LSGRTKLYFILPLLIFVIGFTSNAYGQIVEPIVVTTDKSLYYEGETIVISGEVSEILEGYGVSLLITGPNDDVVLIDQLMVDRYKKFQTETTAGGAMNEAGTGTYTVSVLYATQNRTDETTFQYIGSGATQPSVTISTDKSTYKENEGMYVTYTISKRIPYEKLTITLYDPNDLFTSRTTITDYGLSSQLTSYTTFFPVDNKWKVVGVYTIIAEYGGSKSIRGVEVISSDGTQPKFEDNKDSKGIAPFVDPNQDPQYYVDRYNNEPKYKEWFDSNFPEYDSIYEAVGLEEPKAGLYEIPIVGNVDCKIKTIKALELLRNKAKNHFEIVTDHISIIECVDRGSGIRVQDSSVKIGKITMDAGTIWYAGVLVHESCHSLLYSDYLKNNPQSNYVPSDIYSGRDAEAFCLGLQYYALSLIDHGRYTSDYFVNILKSEYWEIPYEDRWW